MGRTVVRVSQGWLGVVLGAMLVAVPGPGVAGAPASNDPLLASQWGLEQVHAPEAWATAKGDGVVIAVVDTVIDTAHPDLQAKIVPGFDFAWNAW